MKSNKERKCCRCKSTDPAEGFSSSNPSYCITCNRERLRVLRQKKTGKPFKVRHRWVDGHKVCPKCNQRKSLSEYSSIRVSWCRQCCREKRRVESKTKHYKEHRSAYLKEFIKTPRGIARQQNIHLKREYGITLKDKEEMLWGQGGKCDICRCSDPGKRGWVIDHCHRTNKVRAVLCDLCNKMLGQGKDDPVRMLNACRFLIKHQISHEPATVTFGVTRPDDERDEDDECQ